MALIQMGSTDEATAALIVCCTNSLPGGGGVHIIPIEMEGSRMGELDL